MAAQVASSVASSVVGSALCALPLVVLVVSARRHREDRLVVVPLLAGVALVTSGHLMALVERLTGQPAVAAASAPVVVAAYPLLVVALLAALSRSRVALSTVVVLDALAATLGAAALTAWWLESVLGGPGHPLHLSRTGTVHVLVAGLLIALTVGAIGLTGRRAGVSFTLLAAGLLVFAVADAGAVGAWDRHVTPGGWSQVLAPAGLLATACATRSRRSAHQDVLPGLRSLQVLFLSCLAAVAVLAMAPPLDRSPLPGTLALVTLAVSVARLLVAFRQLGELAEVREMALTDELTGIANRRALYLELDRMFERDDRPAAFSVALVDLDHFKAVNDSYGHATGDELLQAVVARFSTALAEQRTRHLLARLGGDEFAVVLHDADTPNAAMACGAALQRSLAEPIELHEVTLHAQASIGIATAPQHGQTRADLLFASDAAMYAAKTSGDPVRYHQPEEAGDGTQPLFVSEDLYGALERDELTVAYQPILSVDGELHGAEALVRWNHPKRGRLEPEDFLEAAERYKLTPAIAERVLDMTLRDLARWRAGGADLSASVNVSVTDLRNEGLVQLVGTALLTHDVPPEKVTVEIAESAMTHDPQRARSVMTALRDLGVRLSVDDYGTGGSSLEFLLTLPIDEIKLDGTFCSSLVEDQRAAAIVRSTVDLTHAMGLRMVAEGVEDVGTLGVLRDLGCDLVQGWHVGRPMPGEAFDVLVAQQLHRGRDMLGQAQVARLSAPHRLREHT